MAPYRGYRGTLAERFERYSIPEPNSGCLLWFGSCNHLGYGQINIDGRKKPATHIALELAGKPVPQGMRACHHCDNPWCVNADHLFIGAQFDNVADMMKKGRQNHSGLRFGRAHNKAPDYVKARARQLFDLGFSQGSIARALCLSRSAVHSWTKEWTADAQT